MDDPGGKKKKKTATKGLWDTLKIKSNEKLYQALL